MKKKTKWGLRIFLYTLLVATITIGCYIQYWTNPLRGISADDKEMFQKWMGTYRLIENYSIENVSQKQLLEGAINGMVATLKDPHSVYMNNDESSSFNEDVSGEFQGIGAEVTIENDWLTVTSPIKHSPAEKAGIRPNDVILKIGKRSTKGMNLSKAVSYIRGKEGSSVTLTIQREGQEKPFPLTITRSKIAMETVHNKVMEQNGTSVGYLQISSFAETTADEFDEQLKKVESQSIKGLIIDVRGNPGGSLDVVEQIAGHFVTKNHPIVQIQDGDKKRSAAYSSLTTKKAYPISILIDEGSASASEILASALKEAEGYEVIGTTSYGKGTVQTVLPLNDGSQLKLTRYKWLTPDGNWIHHKGVKPTIKVKQPDYFYASPLTVKKPLVFDSVSADVANGQLLLEAAGFDPKRQDGYFSQETQEAVNNFQRSKGLPVTGQIDRDTAKALNTAARNAVEDEKNDHQLAKALEVMIK